MGGDWVPLNCLFHTLAQVTIATLLTLNEVDFLKLKHKRSSLNLTNDGHVSIRTQCALYVYLNADEPISRAESSLLSKPLTFREEILSEYGMTAARYKIFMGKTGTRGGFLEICAFAAVYGIDVEVMVECHSAEIVLLRIGPAAADSGVIALWVGNCRWPTRLLWRNPIISEFISAPERQRFRLSAQHSNYTSAGPQPAAPIAP